MRGVCLCQYGLKFARLRGRPTCVRCVQALSGSAGQRSRETKRVFTVVIQNVVRQLLRSQWKLISCMMTSWMTTRSEEQFETFQDSNGEMFSSANNRFMWHKMSQNEYNYDRTRRASVDDFAEICSRLLWLWPLTPNAIISTSTNPNTSVTKTACEIPFVGFWDMVFARFLGRTDSVMHSLTDGQTRIQNASSTVFQWWQRHQNQT